MFPLKCSFNEVVRYLVKLIEWALPSPSFAVCASGPKGGWKGLESKEEGNKCLHSTCSGYTDRSPAFTQVLSSLFWWEWSQSWAKDIVMGNTGKPPNLEASRGCSTTIFAATLTVLGKSFTFTYDISLEMFGSNINMFWKEANIDIIQWQSNSIL